MCGINGIYAYNVAASPPTQRELLATRDAMIKRGPDAAGEWWDANRRVGFGHRRLSIVDLSEGGAQPMASSDGRYIVTFNGEIYNYPLLRRELEADGVQFRSSSDTEVLLVLYARDGAAMTTKLRGMYAFAIWDTLAQQLFLARDPYGIKPLYMSDDGWTFRFASQVKALIAGGHISRSPEPAGIVGFHIWGSVPEPFTLYRDIRALPAGHSIVIDRAGPHPARAFASVTSAFAEGEFEAPQDAIAQFRNALRESVAAHLMADVPIGLFLSAGVDSSALLALMTDAGAKNPLCITLAFEEFRGTAEDETPIAAEVAQHYGARHFVRTVTEMEFRNDLLQIFDAMDQPSIDGINTWFVAKAAREAGLKVAISGLGGDEILAGYSTFHDIPRWVRTLQIPSRVPLLGKLLRKVGSGLQIERMPKKLPGLVEYGGSYPGAYLLRRGLFLPYELYQFLPHDIVVTGLKRLDVLNGVKQALTPAPKSALSRVGALESGLYLRNQLLRDADWAGMAHSTEIRTPFVDFTLLREAAAMVPTLNLHGEGKRILSQTPARALPAVITNRAKTGFNVPTGRWVADMHAVQRSNKGSASRIWSSEVYSALSARSFDQKIAMPV